MPCTNLGWMLHFVPDMSLPGFVLVFFPFIGSLQCCDDVITLGTSSVWRMSEALIPSCQFNWPNSAATHAYAISACRALFNQISIPSGSCCPLESFFRCVLSYFFGKIEHLLLSEDTMSHRRCVEPCDRFITAGDTHDRCVLCLDRHHAQAALSGLSNCQHCDSLRR